MKEKLLRQLKILLVPILAITVLAGCGSDTKVSYPLESVDSKSSGEYSRVYRAENKSVPEVAAELASERSPEEISPEDDERMFLVYDDEWYHLQQDPKEPEDTLIEVDSKEFVQNNYNPSFLEGYIVASLLDDLFDSHHRSYPGNYRGYTTRDIYKPTGSYHKPSSSEKKAAPPITTGGVGSITKRSDSPTISKSSNDDSSITKKSTTSGKVGRITKSSSDDSVFSKNSSTPKRSSIFSSSRSSHSPPKTKSGGFGRLTKRR